MIRSPIYTRMNQGFDIIEKMVRYSDALHFMQNENGNKVLDHVMLSAMEKAGARTTDQSAYNIPLSLNTPLRISREAAYHQSMRLVVKLYRAAAENFARKTHADIERRTPPGQHHAEADRSCIFCAASIYFFSKAMAEVFRSDKILLVGILGPVTPESFARAYGARVDERMPTPRF